MCQSCENIVFETHTRMKRHCCFSRQVQQRYCNVRVHANLLPPPPLRHQEQDCTIRAIHKSLRHILQPPLVTRQTKATYTVFRRQWRQFSMLGQARLVVSLSFLLSKNFRGHFGTPHFRPYYRTKFEAIIVIMCVFFA